MSPPKKKNPNKKKTVKKKAASKSPKAKSKTNKTPVKKTGSGKSKKSVAKTKSKGTKKTTVKKIAAKRKSVQPKKAKKKATPKKIATTKTKNRTKNKKTVLKKPEKQTLIIKTKTIKTPLGDVIAGATEKGICILEWPERKDIERIYNRIQKRYILALKKGGNKHLTQLEKELKQYFSGKLKKFKVKLDLQGTKFATKVWKELLKIPYARTYSYGEVARRLDNPNGARAVGRANGDNYISIVIPCHRVIETSGKLRGYGGGLWRKRYLLDLESGQMRLPQSKRKAISGRKKAKPKNTPTKKEQLELI